MRRPLKERFWEKVDQHGPDECWPWTASKGSNGYGRIARGAPAPSGMAAAAHRVAYELLVGPIPEGLTIDHLCRNRACVNPVHLEPVTNRVNILRGISPTAANKRKTHCPSGHSYDEKNTYLGLRSGRNCRECTRLRKQTPEHREQDRLRHQLRYQRDPEYRERICLRVRLRSHRGVHLEAAPSLSTEAMATMKVGTRTDLMPVGIKSSDAGSSIADAAKLLNVSKQSVHRARVVKNEGDEKLVADVKSGEVSLRAAVDKIQADATDVVMGWRDEERRAGAVQ